MESVDLIIPVYNTEKYLRRCLDSVIAQTRQDWVAICIDDGSTDGSGRILDEYSKKDSRFEVIHSSNAGLSAARNLAMGMAKAEWIMFVDSDDVIHPQTLELSLTLAESDGSDVVCWYKSSSYRWQVKLRNKLGLDAIDFTPWGYRRKYRLERVRSLCTDDLLSHCTEYTHSHIQMPVKHFYVWRHLLRREKIQSVHFIKGLKFEDFPWWSEVILKDLKATITELPLYYRYPNMSSIVNTTKAGDTILSFLQGLEHSLTLYSLNATDRQMEQWSHNCKWAVLICQVVRKLDKVHDESKKEQIRTVLCRLWSRGAFQDDVLRKETLAKRLIQAYIGVVEGGTDAIRS